MEKIKPIVEYVVASTQGTKFINSSIISSPEHKITRSKFPKNSYINTNLYTLFYSSIRCLLRITLRPFKINYKKVLCAQ